MNNLDKYINCFLILMVGYIANEIGDDRDTTNMDRNDASHYIFEMKHQLGLEFYHFHVGAAWATSLIMMFEDYDRIPEKVAKMSDQFTDFVEEFSGIKIP